MVKQNELLKVVKSFLQQVKTGQVKVYPSSLKTVDNIQLMEDLIKVIKVKTLEGIVKREVIYNDENDQTLFKEWNWYTEIPPKGRIIFWNGNHWLVDGIHEDWDTKKIEVRLFNIT